MYFLVIASNILNTKENFEDIISNRTIDISISPSGTSITVSHLSCYVSHWTVQEYFNVLQNKYMASMPGIKIKSFYSKAKYITFNYLQK